MPSQDMDQRHCLSQYKHPIVATSSFSEGLLPIESQIGFWKQESLPHNMGSKSVASSPLAKPQLIGTKIAGQRELLQQYDLRGEKSLEHKLFGQERNLNLSPSPWSSDEYLSCQSDSSLAAALFHDGITTNANGVYKEHGHISRSFSDIFDKKLKLTSKVALVGQPIQKVDRNNVDDEPFELTKEIKAQIIENLLPDDDELLSDVLDEVGFAAPANNREDVDDDIFCTGGGMELETDENKKLQELNCGGNDGLGFLNGTLNGEHLHGTHPSRTLFVRNINSNIEDSELKFIFEHYGDIRTLYTACKHRGFVMISYYDIRSAQNAMSALHNKPLRRRKLDIHYSIPKYNPSEKDLNQGTLVVFNVDPAVSNDDLCRIFGDYGEIKEIHDTPQKGHHKIIEFYDIRGAEAALLALHRNDTSGKKIKVENSHLGGTKCLMQHFSPEFGQEEFGVYKVGNPCTISPSMACSGSTNLATNTFTGLVNGSIPSVSPLRDASFLGRSSTRLQDLSSPVGITSGVNQATLGELSQSLGQMNGHTSFSIRGMYGLTNGVPCNTMRPIGTNGNSRAVEVVDSRHLHKVVSGNLNGHSFDRAEGAPGFSRSGSLPLRGQHLIWSTSTNFHHDPSSPVLWPNPGSFVNNVPSCPPAQMHGLPRPPSPMLENVPPMYHHHVGSAPAINPSVWDRRNGYAGDLTGAPSFHRGSVGSIGFPGSTQLHSAGLNNIFSQTGGNCMDPAMSPAQIGTSSPQQRGLFHGRNRMVPLPSFDSPGERMRSRRNEVGANQSNNKRQFELDVDSILRGEDSRTVPLQSFDLFGERMRSRRNELGANQSDNRRQYELDVDSILRGEDSRTTLMIKNIPNKYTSKMLLTAIDENHKGTYDFIYLPIDFKSFNGKKWEKFNSEKVASLAYARIQGKSALIGHFQNSSLMNEDKGCRPILFHSSGPNAGDQEVQTFEPGQGDPALPLAKETTRISH